MVLFQKWPFFQLFFLGNLFHENVFNDNLERENAFLGYKKQVQKHEKVTFSLKVLTHGFGQKMTIFPTFFY